MTTTREFAAFVGIDWADEAHEVSLTTGNGKHESCTVRQRAEELDAWASELRRRFGGRPVAVCLEQPRGALAYALLKYEFLILMPINPKSLARYREALTPSGGKNDLADARLLCQFVAQHHHELPAWQPDDEVTRALQRLTADRRKWVDRRTALKNELRQQLKDYFPLALELAGKLDADWFLRLLAKFPSHAELRRAGSRTLAKLLPQLRTPVEGPHDPRHVRIREALPLVTDPAVIAAGRLATLSLVAAIRQTSETIVAYDERIAEQLARHPDAALYASFPAAGEALAPRLAAAFGTDRSRYAIAADMQCHSGIAPIRIQSGKSCAVRRRRACCKFLRQTFHEYADHSRKKSAWARAYYQLHRAQGKRHHACLRSLAFKWQRILFRCWKTNTPYDEPRHLRQLQLKGSPLLKYLDANHSPQSN